jgi:hypothetical protein
MYASKDVRKPAVWASTTSNELADGSVAPSSTMRPTWSGKSCAYCAPMLVPYE